MAFDFAIPVHHTGKWKGLPVYEARLHDVSSGKRTTVVAKLIIRDDSGNSEVGGHLCQTLISGQYFRLKGAVADDAVTVTVLNAVVQHYRYPILTIDDSAKILNHRQKTVHDLTKLIETCVGIGGIGTGASYAGWEVVCRNDIQHSFCEWLRQQGGPPVVEGSITRLETIIEIHEKAPNAGTMAWGFACQPFSLLGDQKHQEDNRSDTLPYGLYASWLLQVEFNVLECVPQGGSSGFVQLCLDYHTIMTKGERSETILELSHVWPSRRRRWWTILTKGSFGKVSLSALPRIDPGPVYHNLLSGFLPLSPAAIQQLQLTEVEVAAFHQYGKGMNSHLVDPQAVLGTALHGWGNQAVSCACGCRGPFSHHRLSKGGIYGALCMCQAEEASVVRHLGPQEVALMLGMPMVVPDEAPQRLLLAGLGQIASPIQAAWVFSHLGSYLEDRKYRAPSTLHPQQVMADIMGKLWDIRTQVNHETSVAQQLFREALEEALKRPLTTEDPGRQEVLPTTMPAAHGEIAATNEAGPSTPLQHDRAFEEYPPSVSHHASDPVHAAHTPSEVFLANTGGLVGFSTAVSPGVDAAFPPQQPSRNPLITASQEERTFAAAVSDLPAEETRSRATPPRSEASPTEEVHDPTEDDEDHSEPPPKRPKVWDMVTPDALLEHQTVIYEVAHGRLRTFRASEGTTIAQFRQAEAAFSDAPVEDTKLWTPLETQISPDMLMQDIPMIFQAERPETWNLTGLRERSVSLYGLHRSESMLHQGAAVAPDEMDYYLHNVAESTRTIAMPTLVCPTLEDAASKYQAWEAIAADSQDTHISAWLVGEHWIPIILHQGKIITTDEGAKALPTLSSTDTEVTTRPTSPSSFIRDCGFQAIKWLLDHVQGSQPAPMTLKQAMNWRHMAWVKACLGHLQAESIPLHLGGQTEAEAPVLRLVLEDEFSANLQKKTGDGTKVGTRKKQGKSTVEKPKPSSVQLTPQDIVIPDGVFVQEDGTPLAHISIDQLSSTAHGVVLMNEAAYQPYRSQKVVSKKGLAFLIMAPFSEELLQHGSQVRLPARSNDSGEPVLMTACLIQKGETQVRRSVPEVKHSVDQVATQVIKVMVYKDQVDQPWDQIVVKPIRYILEHTKALQVCRQEDCKCGAWHQTSASPSEPILDVWARDFTTQQYAKVRPSEASVFSCHMRVTEEAFRSILPLSSRGGIYYEPRTPDGRKHDNKFFTCWLAKLSFQEVEASRHTAPVNCSIVRVQQRYGLCTDIAKGQELHTHCKPGRLFFGHAEKITYRVGPMPFGTHRGAMTKLFQQWQWPAQALQPLGRSKDNQGIMWQACSHVPPEATVYVMQHGDVLVTRDSVPMEAKPILPGIEASSLMRKTTSKQTMLECDPWAEAASHLPSQSRPQPSNAQLAKLEEDVVQKVLERVNRSEDEPMEPASDGRMQALEQQVQMLIQAKDTHQAATHDLRTKMDAMDTKIDQQANQFRQCLTTAMQQQMSKIEDLFSQNNRSRSRPSKE
eukprot:Skav210130  [mRNA]  locus=scaffold2194:403822:408421:- [translate_table: standard]